MRRGGAALLVCLLLVTPARALAQEAYAGADSADVVEDLLVNVDPADQADVVETIARERAGEWSRPTRTSGFARLEVVRGYRASERVSAGARGIAVAARRDRDERARWLDARPRGSWLERVTVGGLRVRSGARLVLGARSSRFGSNPTAPIVGTNVEPSVSLWSAVEGAAVALRRRSHRLVLVRWDGREGSSGRWVSLERALAGGDVAVSSGRLVDGNGGGHRDAVALSGRRDAGDCSVAGEVARVGDATLAVVRTAIRSAGEWIVEVFGGAASAEGGVATIDPNTPTRERGASLLRRIEWRGCHSTVSLHTATRAGPDGARRRRRLDASGAFTSDDGCRYDFSARYDLDEETDVPAGSLVEHVESEQRQRGRLRARLEVPVGSTLSLRYRLQTQLASASRPGHIVGLDLRHDGRRVDLRVSLTNFARPGPSYVARPGIAGYESVAAVSHRGSDVSARASIALGAGAVATLYAGVPWNGRARVLASVRWSL